MKTRFDRLIQTTPDVREEIIKRIRAKLRRGSYKVKAEDIAGKMMEDRLMEEILLSREGGDGRSHQKSPANR
jgi:hypothetical protein